MLGRKSWLSRSFLMVLAMVVVIGSAVTYPASVHAAVEYSYSDERSGVMAEGSGTFVSGDHMVWFAGEEPNKRHIFYKNMKSGKVVQITDYLSMKDDPHITELDSGELVVLWIDRVDVGSGSGMWDIFAYYMDSGERIKLSSTDSIHLGISAEGEIAAWYDQWKDDVYIYDLETREAAVFGKGKKPQVAEGKIAYITIDGDIALYTINSGETEVLVDLPYHQFPMEIAYNGTYVLWKENNLDTRTKYVLFDTVDGDAEPIDLTKQTEKDHEFPELFIGDGQAAWVEWNNGDLQLTGVSLEHKETHVITRGEHVRNTLTFEGDQLVMTGEDGSLIYRSIIRTVTDDRNASSRTRPASETNTVTAMVGEQGGTVSTADGQISVIVPKGAFAKSTKVTLAPNENVEVLDRESIELGMRYAGSAAWTIQIDDEIDAGQGIQLVFRVDGAKWSADQMKRMSVYRWDEEQKTWERMGGVVLPEDSVGVGLRDSGTYVLFMNDVSFPDMDGHWAKEQVEVLAARELVNGVGEGRFAPSEPLTRAQFTKMLVDALGVPLVVEGTEPSFQDVSNDHWGYPWIEAAAAQGIVLGSNGVFSPDEVMTREQMAVMLIRALGMEEVAAALGENAAFDDADTISAWAQSHTAMASELGLVVGYDGKFNPQASSDRAAGATVIYRVLELRNDW